MRHVASVVVVCVAGSLAAGCGRGDVANGPLTVFAAASLRAVVDDAATAWEAAHHRAVRVSYGASSTLARQIDAGARADVMLSANPDWIDWLDARHQLAPGGRRVVAENGLVLVAPAGHAFRWAPGQPLAEAFAGKLALGDPAHVPAGVYARQALERLGAWDALADRVVAGADVRDALRFVARGGAPAGIVYRTDALAAGAAVIVVAALPEELHDPIHYVGATVAGGDATAGADFLAWLGGPEGRVVLERYGFGPARDAAR